MNMLRKRPKREPMGVKVQRPEFPTHKGHVRRHACIVDGCNREPIECCHIRNGIPDGDRGAMGKKPADWWTFPACADHHKEQHQIGERRFVVKYALDLHAVAIWLTNDTSDQRMKAWLKEAGRWPFTHNNT